MNIDSLHNNALITMAAGGALLILSVLGLAALIWKARQQNDQASGEVDQSADMEQKINPVYDMGDVTDSNGFGHSNEGDRPATAEQDAPMYAAVNKSTKTKSHRNRPNQPETDPDPATYATIDKSANTSNHDTVYTTAEENTVVNVQSADVTYAAVGAKSDGAKKTSHYTKTEVENVLYGSTS